MASSGASSPPPPLANQGAEMDGLGIDGHWIGIHDADPRAVPIYRRHYSAKRHSRPKQTFGFMGPGAQLVLMTLDCMALFAWRQNQVRWDEQKGIECTIFRNEGPVLSSELILEAVELAWGRWPGERLFTYVWDAKVGSVNPGYCFKKAGWQTCGRNKDGRLTILEIYPEPVADRAGD